MAFSPTDAAFEGFRLTREKPLVIVYWGVASLLISLATAVLMVTLIGPDMAAITQMGQSSDPEAVLAMAPVMGKLYGLTIPLSLITSAIFTCAAYRALLRPQDSAFGYLRFGADELRMILLFFVLTLLFIAVLAGALVLLALIVAGLSFAFGGGGGGTAAAGALGGVIGFLLVLGVGAFFFVRMSLAAPMTFSERRLAIAPAWRMTRGRFWPLLGAYFLAWVLALVVVLLGFAIVVAIIAAIWGLQAIGQVTSPDFSSLAAYFTPAMGLSLLISGFLSALQYAIVLSPPAVAYRELSATDRGGAETFA